MAAAEPPTKKAKTEEKAEKEEAEEKKEEGEEEEKPKEPEPAKELEEDAAVDKTPKIKEKVQFLVQDTTMNVADSMFGNMLTSLSEGGLQYLLAGARANVGVKSGRYMFEVNVVELMYQKQDTTNVTGRVPQPRNFFRIGLSTAGSSLLIGEDEHSICFDAEGSCIHNKKKTNIGAKFERSMNVGLVVNLDPKSPNANTVSLFKDGVRICQPQALPESLKGKALYPTLTFRNVTLHYNFGSVPDASLPFSCRTIQDASTKDAVVSKEDVPKDGKHTALFPVCLPDEGTFFWLDAWLKENPSYTELSDRAILDWAQKSGVARLKPYGVRSSNDKPEMNFGLPMMDDKSIQKMISVTAGLQKRNFVVMEVHANLMKDDRTKLLASFGDFKKVALVVAGEPSKTFKQLTQDAILKDKQDVANAEFKKKLEEEKKKKAAEKKVKEDAKKKKKADKAAKKLADERKKKLQEVLKKREEDKKKLEEDKKKAEKEKNKAEKDAARQAKIDAGEEVPEEVEDEEMEEAKEEEVKEEEEAKEETKEEESEESAEEPMEVEEADPEPPTVELTAEEKKPWFKPTAVTDLTPTVLNASFQKYTLPEKAEGFDEIKYEWQNAAKSAEHLASWSQQKKITARIEDLVVGDWFTAKMTQWNEFIKTCKQKQNDYKGAVAKKAADKAAKEKVKKMKEAAKKAKKMQEEAEKTRKAELLKKKAEIEAKKKADEAKKKAEAAAKAAEAGEEAPAEEEPVVEEPAKEEEAAPMEVEETKAEEEEEEEEEPEEEEEVVDLDAIDVFGVEDILVIGGNKIKVPLFSQFAFEDWALMSLRFELNLLVHGFRKDVKDKERNAIHEDNIAYYYQKYFKKGLSPTFFGFKSVKELVSLFTDTMVISNKKVLETFLPSDFESLNVFVLLAEEARRDRNRRMDMGEEDAKINMQTQTGMLGFSGLGVNAGQMAGISAFAAASGQRLPVAPLMRPQGPGGMVRPAYGAPGGMMPRPQMMQGQMVRPPTPGGWAQPQPAWPRPQMGQMGWGARPASPWGAGPQARPFGAGMVRPGMVRPGGW